MSWLLSKLAGYLWPAVLAGYVALGLWGGVEHFKYVHAIAATEDVKKAWALDKANATTLALQASEQARAKETAWAHQLRSVQDDYDKFKADSAKKLAAFAAQSRADLADNGRLRDALASYAAGSGASGTDTAAAASERAAKLGLLLAEALRLEDETLLAGAESTGAAESNGDAVRTLLAAWPH